MATSKAGKVVGTAGAAQHVDMSCRLCGSKGPTESLVGWTLCRDAAGCRERLREREEAKLPPPSRRRSPATPGAQEQKCVRCQVVKPLEAFTPDRRTILGRMARCRTCRTEDARKGREAPAYAYDAPRRQSYFRNRMLLRDYGITLAEWEALLEAQGFACGVCSKPFVDNGGRLMHTDHDHETGRVRGILCSSCNVGIGGLQDDPDVCRRAADYLERTT